MKTNNYDSGRRAFLKTSAAVATLAALPVSSSASTDAAPTISPASGVKIKEVRTFKLKDALFVQVVADNGVTGWGESSPNNRHVVETFIHTGLKKHVIGRSAWDAEPMWDDMFFDNHDLGHSGALPYAIAGVDIALWVSFAKTQSSLYFQYLR